MSPLIQNMERMMRDIPSMPAVAQKVMHMLGDPRTNNAELAKALSSDQALSTRILQMANSPFFGMRQKVSSISHAIFVMGHAALRSLVITVCTKGLYKNPGLMENKLWEHALCSAIIAKRLAETTKRAETEDAFLCGLLHDIGRTMLVVVWPRDYLPIFERYYDGSCNDQEIIELEKEEFGYDHCEVGARTIGAWNFPPFFARVTRRHHSADKELLERQEDPAIVAIAAQSDMMARRLGFGFKAPDEEIDVLYSVYNEMLGVKPDSIDAIMEYAPEVFGQYA